MEIDNDFFEELNRGFFVDFSPDQTAWACKMPLDMYFWYTVITSITPVRAITFCPECRARFVRPAISVRLADGPDEQEINYWLCHQCNLKWYTKTDGAFPRHVFSGSARITEKIK